MSILLDPSLLFIWLITELTFVIELTVIVAVLISFCCPDMFCSVDIGKYIPSFAKRVPMFITPETVIVVLYNLNVSPAFKLLLDAILVPIIPTLLFEEGLNN